MKVDIKRSESTVGLFKKKKVYVVTVTVLFSEEEKKVIEECDIVGHTICERPVRAGQKPFVDPTIWHLRVGSVITGEPNAHEFFTLSEANNYNDALPDSLRNVKRFIENNSRPQEDTSFEL